MNLPVILVSSDSQINQWNTKNSIIIIPSFLPESKKAG
jgi:hypothetical protein